MAVEKALVIHTEVAAVDLSSSQFCALVLASGGWQLPSGAGVVAQGVLQNAPAAGVDAQGAMIGHGGLTKARTNGTVAKGEAMAVAASTGKFRQAQTNDIVCGYAVDGDGGVDGTVVTMMMDRGPGIIA